MANLFKINSVTSFNTTSVVTLGPLEQFQQGRLELAFKDSNNNGVLDQRDQKVSHYDTAVPKSVPGRRITSAEGTQLILNCASVDDVKEFGEMVSAKFKWAQQQRKFVRTMDVIVKGVEKGDCGFGVIDLLFLPALSISTKPINPKYRRLESRLLNPGRCSEASGVIFGISKVELTPIIHGLSIAMSTSFTGVERIFGFFNALGVQNRMGIDVGYTTQDGVEVMHVDL